MSPSRTDPQNAFLFDRQGTLGEPFLSGLAGSSSREATLVVAMIVAYGSTTARRSA